MHMGLAERSLAEDRHELEAREPFQAFGSEADKFAGGTVATCL